MDNAETLPSFSLNQRQTKDFDAGSEHTPVILTTDAVTAQAFPDILQTQFFKFTATQKKKMTFVSLDNT